MQKSDESYFLDSKLLNNLKQSTQLQSQLKVFLYKDIDLIAAKNSSTAPATSTSSTVVTHSENSQSASASTRSSRRSKRNLHESLGQTINLNDKDLQDYLLMILKFYQRSEQSPIIHNLKLFLEDSANFFIIENYSKNRQQKLRFLQQQARQTKYT